MISRALLGAIVACLVSIPAAAAAAPAAIDPLELYRSERIDGTRVGLAADSSGAIVLDDESAALELATIPRTRDGAYGPLQELSRTANAELPPALLFDGSGRGFAAWGVATNGAIGEWARRSADGLFGAVAKTGSCGRFLGYDLAPDGTIAVACSFSEGTPPNDDVVRFGELAPTAESFAAGSGLSGAGIDDPFIHPLVSVGAEGTVAVGWYEEDATTGANKVEVRVRPAGSGFEPVKTLVATTAPDEDDLVDLEVLPDGTVLALVYREPGLELYTRSPGPAGAWSGPISLAADEAFGKIAVDAAGRATLAVEHTAGFPAPTVIAAATRPPGGEFGPLTPLASGELGLKTMDAAPDGTALVAWVDFSQPAAVLLGALAAPGAGFGAPVTIATGFDSSDLAIEPGGNVLAAWDVEPAPDDERLMVGGIDSGAPPRFGSVDVPATVLAGAPVFLSAEASDWSGLREIRWTLPGGTVLHGAKVTHTFATAGTVAVQVTAVDRAGNEATVTRDVRVVSDAPPAPDTRRPTLGLKTLGRLELDAFLRGVKARINLDEPSRVTVQLLARAKSAQISASGNLILGSRLLKRVSGTQTVRVRPSRKLIGSAQRFRAQLRVTAVDAAGNESVKQLPIRVG